MLSIRYSTWLLVPVAVVLVFLTGAPGQPNKKPPLVKPINEIVQEFPTNEEMQTA